MARVLCCMQSLDYVVEGHVGYYIPNLSNLYLHGVTRSSLADFLNNLVTDKRLLGVIAKLHKFDDGHDERCW